MIGFIRLVHQRSENQSLTICATDVEDVVEKKVARLSESFFLSKEMQEPEASDGVLAMVRYTMPLKGQSRSDR